MEITDFKTFCENFDIVDNALDMRTLIRWNGRDMRRTENLSEHTHLVVACAIYIYDYITCVKPAIALCLNFEQIVKIAMLHDSLEMLRGDILSVTKDVIPGLREATDNEERMFYEEKLGKLSQMNVELVKVADLMACMKFVQRELSYPSNNFTVEVYSITKEKFHNAMNEFCDKYWIENPFGKSELSTDYEFCKGYQEDAGCDIILKEDAVFMPMSSCSFSLKVKVTPEEGHMAILCARTSAAVKGLVVATCPIDANFNGEITAIVHNVSNNIIKYNKGESFCQVVTLPICDTNVNYVIKKEGKRSDGKLGSTGR